MTKRVESIFSPLQGDCGARDPQSAEDAIARLKESRKAYKRNLMIDARKTGALWLHHKASYEQIIYLAMLENEPGFVKVIEKPEPDGLFAGIDAAIEQISAVPGWCRDDDWHVNFIASAVASWREIAAEVEREA